MPLLDRLLLKQDIESARTLILKGERSITTTCLDKTCKITGIADYVIGYGHAQGLGNDSNLESTFLVIGA